MGGHQSKEGASESRLAKVMRSLFRPMPTLSTISSTVFYHSLGHQKDFADLLGLPGPGSNIKLIFVLQALPRVLLLTLEAIGSDRRV
jgi:hypothetical protein